MNFTLGVHTRAFTTQVKLQNILVPQMAPSGPLPGSAPPITVILISIIIDELCMFSNFMGMKSNSVHLCVWLLSLISVSESLSHIAAM